MPPDPALAAEIARVHRLEAADVITWWESAELIAGLTDGKRGAVHMLARLPLSELQGRWLLMLPSAARAIRGDGRSLVMPMSRDQLVAQILDRVS
jgi:hypothetical protein